MADVLKGDGLIPKKSCKRKYAVGEDFAHEANTVAVNMLLEKRESR